jgi:hypothetical protein
VTEPDSLNLLCLQRFIYKRKQLFDLMISALRSRFMRRHPKGPSAVYSFLIVDKTGILFMMSNK